MTRNMKGVTDIRQWRSALTGNIRKKVDTEIFHKLKTSYDYLKDPTLQYCFLYFPSLPSDHGRYREKFIHKSKLVKHIVDQGIIKRTSSRREEVDNAYTMVNFLW
ncbi:hypothetical protein M5689_025235 [Euphorbia peplus]|nr:hypothetical protein M5689_025235 [Euphorbia peplus]